METGQKVRGLIAIVTSACLIGFGTYGHYAMADGNDVGIFVEKQNVIAGMHVTRFRDHEEGVVCYMASKETYLANSQGNVSATSITCMRAK